MKIHGNSRKNKKPHHLYVFHDKQEDEVYKYGISSEEIGSDGLSSRVRRQLNLFNRVAGWARFFARILIKNIPGRERAEDLEQEHIEAYERKYGRKPRGNVR